LPSVEKHDAFTDDDGDPHRRAPIAGDRLKRRIPPEPIAIVGVLIARGNLVAWAMSRS
jgi:hypothetical protein